MTPNQILVRNLVGVVTAIAAITTAALWFGQSKVPAVTPSSPRAAIDGKTPLAELGARLFRTKGCEGCHTIDGAPRVGPSFKGSWGTQVELAGGITLRFDEAYVRESLLAPQAKARPGYPPSMPSYEGLLRERDVEALIAFLRSIE